MCGVSGELTGDQVAHDGTLAALLTVFFGDDQVDHLVVGEDLHGAEVDLALECCSCGQLELLTRLATGVVGAGDLHTTEGTGGEGSAVLAGEGGTDSVHVVDDADGLVGKTPAVGLTTAVVATLDGVLDVAVCTVVVNLLAAGGVNATLCGDRVRTARGVVVGESLNVVSEFAEGCGGTSTGQAGTDNDDAELTTVQRGDQLHVVFVVLPSILHGDASRRVVAEDLTDGHTFHHGGGSCEVGLSDSFRVSAHIVFL